MPIGCQSTETEKELLFYCKSGTTGRLVFDYIEKLDGTKSQNVVDKVIKGTRTSYFLEVKVYENNNLDLGKEINCPD